MTRLVYCGAHVGESLVKLVGQFDHVDAIEANPELCEILKRRFPPHVTVHNIAVAEKFGMVELELYGADGGSSSLAQLNPAAVDVVKAYWPEGHFNFRGRVQVEAWNLYEWLQVRNIDTVDFLVTDVQGYDAAVLETLEPMLASGAIRKVQCEVDSDVPHYLGAPDNSVMRVVAFFARLAGWRQVSGPRELWHADPDHLQADLVFEYTPQGGTS